MPEAVVPTERFRKLIMAWFAIEQRAAEVPIRKAECDEVISIPSILSVRVAVVSQTRLASVLAVVGGLGHFTKTPATAFAASPVPRTPVIVKGVTSHVTLSLKIMQSPVAAVTGLFGTSMKKGFVASDVLSVQVPAEPPV
jgi:hypothetical protein